MSRFDINCMVGHWPFRKLRYNKPEDRLKTHMKNDITISSLTCSSYFVCYNENKP